MTHIIGESGVTVWLSQQELHDGGVAVLAGTHEGGGAVKVLLVAVGALLQQQLHHVLPALTGGQHQRRLPRLWHKAPSQPEVSVYTPHPHPSVKIHLVGRIILECHFSREPKCYILQTTKD